MRESTATSCRNMALGVPSLNLRRTLAGKRLPQSRSMERVRECALCRTTLLSFPGSKGDALKASWMGGNCSKEVMRPFEKLAHPSGQ